MLSLGSAPRLASHRLGSIAGPAVLGLVAALILAALGVVSGHITVNKGYGYDGEHYARMIEIGFKRGTPAMRMRPVVLLINDEVNYHIFHDPRATFRAMNLVYAFALAMALTALCLHYTANRAAAATLVVNLFLCISVAKMFAYYPTLVDLGAYAVMTAAVWAMVSDRRLLIVVTSLLAVLSREFGIVTVLFGLARDWRLGRSRAIALLTYAPAVLSFFWIRRFVARYSSGADVNEPVLSMGGLLATLFKNTELWADPAYVGWWLYFAATLFGGISLFLITTSRPIRTCLRHEPEWLLIVIPILAVTTLGKGDMWRYSAFLIPAVPAFWAWGVSAIEPRRVWLLFGAVTVATLVTQRPWQYMTLDTYFRDWFPYVLLMSGQGSAAELQSVWTTYGLLATGSLIVIAVLRRWASGSASRTVVGVPPVVK